MTVTARFQRNVKSIVVSHWPPGARDTAKQTQPLGLIKFIKFFCLTWTAGVAQLQSARLLISKLWF